jgi:hypothetical protein
MSLPERKGILSAQHEVIPCQDLVEWAQWYEDDRNRKIQQESISGFFVSTIFLGLDMGYSTPRWFETMVFREHRSVHSERYATWDEAIAGHGRVCAQVRSGAIGE